MWEKKWFGFWKQDGDYYASCPDFNEWMISDCELEPDQKIIDYLSNGSFVSASPIYVNCHICEETIDSSKVILTDGIWMWPKDLVHYISLHKLKIPDEFYAHMNGSNFNCPIVDDDFDMMCLETP
jgi:hypothetical protein